MTDVDLTGLDKRVMEAEQAYAAAARALCEAVEARIVAKVRSFYPTATKLLLSSHYNEDGDLRLSPEQLTNEHGLLAANVPDIRFGELAAAIDEDLLWLADLRGADWDNNGPFISTR